MKHFQLYELVDRRTFEAQGDTAWDLFRSEALEALDDLRDYFDAPITVNNWHDGGPFQWRGYRTREKAAELGAPNSRHAHGDAFDCDITGITAEEARHRICANKDHPLLNKIMRLEGRVPWLHFDLMPGSSRIHVFFA